jgi:hypothetical protein
MNRPDINWPPRDVAEKTCVIEFILHELDRIDATRPLESAGTGLLMRLLKAWEKRGEDHASVATIPRKRGRPKKGELDRLPGLEEFIALDAERVRALLREHWGKSNYTQPFIPTVAEIVVARWKETAEQHHVPLTTETVANLLKRNKAKQRRLANVS